MLGQELPDTAQLTSPFYANLITLWCGIFQANE